MRWVHWRRWGLTHVRCGCRCDIMIHTANEFTAQHHRYLLSGTTLGLRSLGGGDASEDKAASDSKASNASALTRWAPAEHQSDRCRKLLMRPVKRAARNASQENWRAVSSKMGPVERRDDPVFQAWHALQRATCNAVCCAFGGQAPLMLERCLAALCSQAQTTVAWDGARLYQGTAELLRRVAGRLWA